MKEGQKLTLIINIIITYLKVRNSNETNNLYKRLKLSYSLL